MKACGEKALRAIASVQQHPDWPLVGQWLRESRDDMTIGAMRSADPKLCGAAHELHLICEIIETATERLRNLPNTRK